MNQPHNGVVKQNSNAIFDSRQYPVEQPLVYSNFCHLKRNLSAASDNLRSGFDKFHEEAAN
ncbi:hypothetical protein ACFL1R_00485 [Candidatus Latescibacterota bacterium]